MHASRRLACIIPASFTEPTWGNDNIHHLGCPGFFISFTKLFTKWQLNMPNGVIPSPTTHTHCGIVTSPTYVPNKITCAPQQKRIYFIQNIMKASPAVWPLSILLPFSWAPQQSYSHVDHSLVLHGQAYMSPSETAYKQTQSKFSFVLPTFWLLT